jgi:hypothetical protein
MALDTVKFSFGRIKPIYFWKWEKRKLL